MVESCRIMLENVGKLVRNVRKSFLTLTHIQLMFVQAIVAAYENLSSQMSNETQSNNHAMLGVHASAWSIIYYGYIARKHGLTGVCLDSLSRIHTIPSVPIVDCFQKIRQQVSGALFV